MIAGERKQPVLIIGGGLAGCEAAWQLLRAGVPVRMYEMRPGRMTLAHRTGRLAELVCSNSLRSTSLDRAQGVLKAELRILGSLILHCAEATAVPAGDALAVDREKFAQLVEERLLAEPNFELVREEVCEIPDDELCIVATGPMTSEGMAAELQAILGRQFLHFYDAVSPIVSADSIDMSKVFCASRYEKGEPAYLNCPMTKEQYEAFHRELVSAAVAEGREFDPREIFEGCVPLEEVARRGVDALRYGAMKPVGLVDPRTGERPWAVVQLRAENKEKTMYSLVGFQTGLRWGEQRRVFRMIPGLENAEFLRYGVMHRNVFVDGPRCLDRFQRPHNWPKVFLAGQLTGVEGYVESTMSGLFAGINAARLARGEGELLRPPAETVCGALLRYVTESETPDFQPMNANFGLLPPVEGENKKERRAVMAQRALEAMRRFCEEHGLGQFRR